jgi:hypothetical protein
MSARLKTLGRFLHRHLAGAGLLHALERHRAAAEALDRAVREVLQG